MVASTCTLVMAASGLWRKELQDLCSCGREVFCVRADSSIWGRGRPGSSAHRPGLQGIREPQPALPSPTEPWLAARGTAPRPSRETAELALPSVSICSELPHSAGAPAGTAGAGYTSCLTPRASSCRGSPTSQGLAPAPHLKGLPEHQREDVGRPPILPAAALESVGHHGGTENRGLMWKTMSPVLGQEVGSQTLGAPGWRGRLGGHPTEAKEGTQGGEGVGPLLVLSRVRVSLHQRFQPGARPPREGFNCRQNGWQRPWVPGPSLGCPPPRRPHSLWAPGPGPGPEQRAHRPGGLSLGGGARRRPHRAPSLLPKPRSHPPAGPSLRLLWGAAQSLGI